MNLIHNFDELTKRRNTDSKKYSSEYFPEDIIPMWIADTDFKSPQPLVAAIAKRAEQGIYGYTPVSRELKAAAASWMKSRFCYEVSESSVEYVPGVIGGMICAIRGLTNVGDKVLLQTPAYPPFVEGIENNGRRLAVNRLLLKNDRYEIDFEAFENQCKDPLTRMFLLCNPHNPTGRVFTRDELVRMGQICMENHVLVVSDEIHCDIVYQGNKHLPFASISPEFEKNSLTFISPSKTFNVPGFRTAVMIAANPLLKELVHQVIISNKASGENIFGTVALCAAYEHCAYYADQLTEYLQGNLELVKKVISEIPGMKLVEPEGTYLFWIDCRELGLSQEELMEKLVKEAKVGVHDGLHFGEEGRGFVRMNAACPRQILLQALNQIRGLAYYKK